ncbi:hypothetical protein IP88_03575 [alpha proteobacterium AAP81b]|nr:hypothetical protein IP88_03575 [alpha proteobacterium AAP81b]
MLSSAPAWRVSPGVLVALLAALGFAGWAAFEPRLFNDGDTGWHLATARWMFANGRVPTSDPFSWTALGKPWQAHEWLAEVLLGLGERVGGWRGVALVPGLAIGAMVAIVGAEAARWLDWRKVIIALTLLVGALLPFCLARPHVIAWPLLAGWTVLLLRAREGGHAPPLAAALVMLVWANLHASWLLGLGIAGVFGLEALVAGPDRRGVLIDWGSFGLLSGLAVLLTPQGFEGVTFPFYVSGMQALNIIAEWRPTSFVRYPAFEAWLLALVAVALWRGVRVPVLRLALIVGLMHLAFQHERHQAVLVIVATLLMVRPIGEGFGRPAPVASLPLGWLPPLLLAGLIAMRLAIPTHRPETRANPARAIAAVPASLRAAHVFNSYSIGGTLIFHGIRPFVDGRADLYGDALVKDFWAMHQGDMPRFRSVAAARDIRWTILERKAPLARALDREPGWKRLYADRFAVVHVRQR